jgi:WD40 repeat protein
MISENHRRELAHLVGLLCEDDIAPEELAQLEAMLLDNPETQRLYHELVAVRVDLTWTPIAAATAAAPAAAPEGAAEPRVVPARSITRRGWYIAATAALAASVLLAAWLLSPGGNPPHGELPAADHAQVVAVYGDVRLVSLNGEMQSLVEGQAIGPGQIVSTGREESVVTLEYPDATRLILGTDSLAQLPSEPADVAGPGRADVGDGARTITERARRVFLFRGFLRAEMPAQPATPTLVLASAHAEVATGGSEVNFWTSAEETRVESDKGRLKLTRRGDKQAVDMLTDSFVVVAPERADLKPQPLPARMKPRLTFKEGSGPVVAIAFAPDGQTLAVGGCKGQVQFVDLHSGKSTRAPLNVAKHPVRALAYTSTNGKTLAIAADEKERLKLWDLTSDAPGRATKGPRTMIRGLVCFGDLPVLASGGGNKEAGELKFWHARSGAPRADLAGHGQRIMDVAVSGDGKLLATASKDRSARLWDTATAMLLRILPAQQGELLAIAVTYDGQLVATGGQDGTVTLWDSTTGEERRRWHVNPRAVRSLAFSPDGRLLATAADHPAAKLWEVATGREVAALRSQGHVGCAVRFSPDGRSLAVADMSGHVTLWDVP